MAFIAFGNGETKLYFDKEKGYLEQIEYKNQLIPLHSKLWNVQTNLGEIEIAGMTSFYTEQYNGVIKLIWTSDIAKVIVTLHDGKEGKICWNISTEVYGEDAVRRVRFPVFEGLKFTEENYLLITWQNGHLLKNPVDTFLSKGADVPFWVGRGKYGYENEYPAALSFQFSTFYSPKQYGYYFATEDSDAYIKTYAYQYNEKLHAMDFSVIHYPENMGSATSYCMPYDFVLCMFEGDWQTATKLYRTWAIKQKWCPENICERKLPQKMMDTDLWWMSFLSYDLGTRPGELLDSVLKLREILDCNVSVHWYGWNRGTHDHDYPDYISAARKAEGWPEELRQWNKKFDEAGVAKIPYINARLWEQTTKSWEKNNVLASAIKTEEGKLPEEPWAGRQLKPVCPATALWQNKVVELCREYILEEGFDGVYLDQIASYNATLCFDSTHPHPIGGGTWWNDSYHNMVRRVREILGEERILTTESCCETYIDVFDLLLVEDTNFQEIAFNGMTGGGDTKSVPLFSMIYGDYALSYGSRLHFGNRDEHFEYNLMNNILWGILPLVDATDVSQLEDEKSAEKLAVLKRGIDFFKTYKDVFFYGRLCEIPYYSCDMLELAWTANSEEGNTYDYIDTFPAVNAAVWETKTGEKLLFVYNYSDCVQRTEIQGQVIEVPARSFCKFDLK